MRVYNLTDKPLDFRGRVLPANGGSTTFPELDGFVPDRERQLEKAGVIAIGSLPVMWRPRSAPPVTKATLITSKLAVPVPTPLPAPVYEKLAVEDTVEPETKGWVERPIHGSSKKDRR